LLKQCPNLKILATSREALGIFGEASYPVPSLGVPDVEKLMDSYREFESVRLFEERAQLAQFDFALTMDNASSIAQICQRLDGIPLAIELAAVHVGQFSPPEIATQLNDSFKLLSGGSRTALPRQQTLRASIDWSWGLLSDAEQIFLRQLSVFAGGWTLESAQAICDVNALTLISTLVKKSLMVVI
jgi:predicted ATPase